MTLRYIYGREAALGEKVVPLSEVESSLASSRAEAERLRRALERVLPFAARSTRMHRLDSVPRVAEGPDGELEMWTDVRHHDGCEACTWMKDRDAALAAARAALGKEG